MEPHSQNGAQNLQEQLDVLLRRALLLDLEVSHQGKILKLGAVLGEQELRRSGGGGPQDNALSTMARDADCLLGYNLVRHDLPMLRAACSAHPLLGLPVIDTLVLSPICFPENPYHRLVKDYKLVRESVNDPVADARQSATLFRDEFKVLAGLQITEPRLFVALHYLLATPDTPEDLLAAGMGRMFRVLGGSPPSPAQALALCRELSQQWACASVPFDERFLRQNAQRMALAYTLAWLRVAGSNSVLPLWVRRQYPQAVEWLKQWRDTPCAAPDCAYCRRIHNAHEQLHAFFGWDSFREMPRNPQGGSLQQDIVEAGMRGESLLAILPTGGGKSLCFQLPALVRNYRRGVLTIIISPLQALMKDQVDGLVRRTGTAFAAALYGLLTPPERGDVLRRVRLGDVALLYVSPEQLRNRSFGDAIAQREIGCWVFDEAHCLSKWGHDFRPDYLYAGRFIREFSAEQGVPIPPIVCFTATAKRDVRDEIIAFFKNETGRDLALYEGGVERDNLTFAVHPVTSPAKLENVHELLLERFGFGAKGSAIIFRSTRNATEETSVYLRGKGWAAGYFHAGLSPTEKKRIQNEFLGGELQIICATNAFGMGIDKEDVRLVVHADTPGSLENYLQEAGRAGRDGHQAECVLLYNEEDCEQQFSLASLSELSRHDIAQILRGLRKAARHGREEIVITAGELLRDEELQTSIDIHQQMADTKVRTAVSWLERAGFLHRNENATNVFQARLLVRNMAEAERLMAPLHLSDSEKALWWAILRELINARPTDSLTVDKLALLSEFSAYAREGPGKGSPEYISAKILKILGSMAQANLLRRDLLLNAFVRHKVADQSQQRLDRVLLFDRKLLALLAEEDPDPEGWLPLTPRLLNQRLCDDGVDSSMELIRTALKCLAEDGRGFAGTHGSVELRQQNRETLRVRIRRSWSAISELADKRRKTAALVLGVLLAKIPPEAPASAEHLVEFSFEELHRAVEQDMFLCKELKDTDAALERALMYLHEIQAIILQQGLAVFRSAMTIRLLPDARGTKYQTSDYQPLAHHYGERILQIHVISEYARRGLERIGEALGLVLAYFTMEKEAFTHRYLGDKPELLKHATTAASYDRIVTRLENPAQIKVVTAPPHRNLLILAGPGSGKTKTVVHRCAYLVRVERVKPHQMLVCCYNRQAAMELRLRLENLVGKDARGVMVLTYHALAMRLLGHSFSGKSSPRGEMDFGRLITDATALLRGDSVPVGLEPDEARERLLAGFQYILVDEYQDIDAPQYELISAIAGRTLADPDQRLSILAVGDDDQNIYSFRGTNVEFIRRFQDDYEAEVHFLVENYRSTRNLIDAANRLITVNADRMKTSQPGRINQARRVLPAGGDFESRDPIGRGKLQIIPVQDSNCQAQAVLVEILRLRQFGVEWPDIAVLSSTHRDLAQVRALAEAQSIPIRWQAGRNGTPPLNRIREIHPFLRQIALEPRCLTRASALRALVLEASSAADQQNPWQAFLLHQLDAWQDESGDAETSVREALEFLYEACAESRREFSFGEGVLLSTVHSAKGTEYNHVLLIGPWPLPTERTKQEENRRAFYVGMTRARQTLAIFDRADIQPSLPGTVDGPNTLIRLPVIQPAPSRVEYLNYTVLGLDDINLGYPGFFPERHPMHQALADLKPGDRLGMHPLATGGMELRNLQGVAVARLSRKGETEWTGRLDSIREIRVLGMVVREQADETDAARQERFQTATWELPWTEVVHREEDRGKSDRSLTKAAIALRD